MWSPVVKLASPRRQSLQVNTTFHTLEMQRLRGKKLMHCETDYIEVHSMTARYVSGKSCILYTECDVPSGLGNKKETSLHHEPPGNVISNC
jgi:hypothetical protein